MNYTIFLTRSANRRWQASVPTLPNCFVEAPSRTQALENIQKRILSIVTQSEVLNLRLESSDASTDAQLEETPWELFGSGDASWNAVFDEIELRRDAHTIE